MKKNIYTALLLLLSLSACKPKYIEPDYSLGDVNKERFILIGGGHFAGYMDDALYREGQENSLANLIAKSFKLELHQPLVNNSSVGIGLSGLSAMKLGYKTDCKDVTSLSPIRIAASGDQSIFNDNLFNAAQSFGNYGIPGLKLMDINTNAYATQNAYFARMASSVSATVLDDILTANPSFFALFLGLEDVMAYAKSGGTEELPIVADFETAYAALVQNLTANGAKGVIATLPDVTQMPYFTTIPWNGLTLDSASNITLNSIYNPLGFNFEIGSNPFMIEDTAANIFGVRQIYSDELVLLSLPLDSVKCNQMGVLFPIRNEFVLNRVELAELRSKIEAYNIAIRNIALQYNLAVVESAPFFQKLTDGFIYNGVTMSAKFVSGGAYSLDGIHFNPRGNAFFANEFIKAINNKFNSRIPILNAGDYRSILFPN
jgi:hypothetical protein